MLHFRHVARAALLWALASADATAALTFDYDLDNRFQTSAGVYDSTGHLIRTLWSNQTRLPGPHQESWDGLDDDGNPRAPGGTYEIRLLAHNTVYTWDGVIGNTSEQQVSATHHDYQYFMPDFETGAGRLYALTASEGVVPRVRYYEAAHPNGNWAPRPGLESLRGNNFDHLAVDASHVYISRSPRTDYGTAPDNDAAFVIALDPDLTSERSFSQGRIACTALRAEGFCYRDGRKNSEFSSAVDITHSATGELATRNRVTGMAVQLGGELLFVAHGDLNELHVLNKQSGELLQTASIAGIGELAVCPSTTDPRGRTTLWAVHLDGGGARVVSRFVVTESPTAVAVAPDLTLAGLVAPLNVALSPDCTTVVVPDGGSRQQIRAFDTLTGAPSWSKGQAGGYVANGPAVSANKLSFTIAFDSNTSQATEQAFVVYSPDGSLWVADTGLSRVLKFNASRDLVDQMAWVPINYHVRVDLNDPTRVFQGYKEYTVDYSQPIEQSWTLVADYTHSLPASPTQKYHGSVTSGFGGVATLTNGHTYALVPNNAGGQDVAEIIAGQPLRFTGRNVPAEIALRANGELQSVRNAAGNSSTVEFYTLPLNRIDAADNPEWGAPVVTASVTRGPRDPNVDFYFGTGSRPVVDLGNGLKLLFEANIGRYVFGQAPANQFRLAAARPGDSTWVWRASAGIARFDLANPDGRFDLSVPSYASMAADALGPDLVYNYHGEFWSDGIQPTGQANQFLHFDQSGLFLGQFGVPAQFDIPPGTPGTAGNSFSIQLVRANDGLYFWHNDEHAHSGLHRWRVDGAEWARLRRASGTLGGAPITLAADPQPLALSLPAPTDLNAVDIGNLGLLYGRGSDVLLYWVDPANNETGFEVQKLTQTYTGLRFQAVGRVGPNVTQFVDRNATPGTEPLYRVRALYGNRRSDYSLHVRPSTGGSPTPIYAENFDGTAWQTWWAPPDGTCWPYGNAPSICGAFPENGSAGNRVFQLRYQTPADGSNLDSIRGWRAPPLLAEFNAAMAKPMGSTPTQYRIEFDARLVSRPDAGKLDLALNVGPFFSKTGGRLPLPVTQFDSDTDSRGFRHFATVLTAIPNGRPDNGVANYLVEEASPLGADIQVRTDGAPANETVELMVDNFSVSRLDETLQSTASLPSDNELVTVPDAVLRTKLINLLQPYRLANGVAPNAPLTRGELRRIAYLDLQGLAVSSLAGLEAAAGLRVVNLTGVDVADLGPLQGLPDLAHRIGASGGGGTSGGSAMQVPLMPGAALALCMGLFGVSALRLMQRRSRKSR